MAYPGVYPAVYPVVYPYFSLIFQYVTNYRIERIRKVPDEEKNGGEKLRYALGGKRR